MALNWEEVQVGDEIPPLSKIATTQMLVKWAGATGDFNPIHYDYSFAASQGLSMPIIYGELKRAWLVQLLTNWMGEEGTIKRLSCRFRAMDYPRKMKTITEPQDGDTWWCKGRVTKKQVKDGEHHVDCNIWVENNRGEISINGRATITLPGRT